MTTDEKQQLRVLLAALRLPGERRATRRLRPSHRGSVDGLAHPARVARGRRRAGRLRRRAPVHRARRVVLLVDVSGSMEGYADALLRFAHAPPRRGGGSPDGGLRARDRLTRLTRELALRDPDAAMAAVAAALPDAGGGTRLGELVKQFLDQWGQRGTARGAGRGGAVDGWERGDASLLGAQMARLHRLAHRVVWCNPRKAHPATPPLAPGWPQRCRTSTTSSRGTAWPPSRRWPRSSSGAARRRLAGRLARA
jgi:uncharacterized protein with von Willebrand factor type A (vWA) domain